MEWQYLMGRVPMGHTGKQGQKNHINYLFMVMWQLIWKPDHYLPATNKDGHFGLGFNINGKTTVFNQ